MKIVVFTLAVVGIILLTLGILRYLNQPYTVKETPVPETQTFKTRVVPYTQNGTTYVVQYRQYGRWHNLCQYWCRLYPESASDVTYDDMPVIGGFDQMVNRAKQFKSIEDVQAFQAEQKRLYTEKVKQVTEARNKRMSQTWESE
jgi:hypothetical protein